MEEIKNRLLKNHKNRLQWIKSQMIHPETNSFRLYDRDIPAYPFIIDIYGDYVVVWEKGKKLLDEHDFEKQKIHHDEVKDILHNHLNFPEDKIIFKKRQEMKGKNQYEKKEISQSTITHVFEGPLTFKLDLTTYIDVGLFLDHRPLRKIIQKKSQGQKVLNLFSYTGSLSCAAAMGGAKKVVSVDLSSTYLNWSQENFHLNKINLDDHEFIQGDCLKALKEFEKNKITFDCIIIDPPTFSNSKRMDYEFDVQIHYVFLIEHALKILSPQGVIYFSTNKRDFKWDYVLPENIFCQNITEKTIPKDFTDLKIHQCFEISKKRF
jgi:23S rRNA (cytosine1962-C5)-methyltransferase